MAGYIEREKVYEMLNAIGGCGAEPESWADGWDKAIDTAIKELSDIPAADVRPERHGKWLGEFREIWWTVWCSECGDRNIGIAVPAEWIADPKHKYCGNCGAKMDGKENKNGQRKL